MNAAISSRERPSRLSRVAKERRAERRGTEADVPELPEMEGFGEPGIKMRPRRAGPIGVADSSRTR